MDKINIKFIYNDYEYCYRIPENFNWFEMYRTKKFTDKFYVYESIIYNDGNIFQNAYMTINSPDIIDLSYRTEKQRESIMNDFIKTLIINNGKNDISLTFANKLNININDVFNYEYSMSIRDFLFEMFDEVNSVVKIKDEIIIEAENILNNNPYNILEIEKKEYSNEDLSKLFNDKMNKLLDAYNTIKKENVKSLKFIKNDENNKK